MSASDPPIRISTLLKPPLTSLTVPPFAPVTVNALVPDAWLSVSFPPSPSIEPVRLPEVPIAIVSAAAPPFRLNVLAAVTSN